MLQFIKLWVTSYLCFENNKHFQSFSSFGAHIRVGEFSPAFPLSTSTPQPRLVWLLCRAPVLESEWRHPQWSYSWFPKDASKSCHLCLEIKSAFMRATPSTSDYSPWHDHPGVPRASREQGHISTAWSQTARWRQQSHLRHLAAKVQATSMFK